MEIKDIDGNSIELKFVEAEPQELSKEQLLKILTLYQKAFELVCEDINSEWRVSGSKEKEPFIKVEPAVDVGQLEMYYLDQANEFYSKKEV